MLGEEMKARSLVIAGELMAYIKIFFGEDSDTCKNAEFIIDDLVGLCTKDGTDGEA